MEVYSPRGAYLALFEDGAWAFVHDVVPRPWIRLSGSGLSAFLRPWGELPEGAVWVPTVRAFARPWECGDGPVPEDLPRGPTGEELVLVGPPRCPASVARVTVQLLCGRDAIAAAQEAIVARRCARQLLHGPGTFVCRPWEARLVTRRLVWRPTWHRGWVLLVATHGEERTLVAGGDWIAAGDSLDQALRAWDEAYDATEGAG